MDKKVVLIVMDGVGYSENDYGNAVKAAYKPTLDNLLKTCPNTKIKAHGTAVGLPSDEDMGNSEVGHNALGCGQIYSQGAKLVNESIDSGKMYESAIWDKLINNCKVNHSVFHFLGLLSDGNVHSNISHLNSMLRHVKAAGVEKCRVHILLDGRDVPATSALKYIDELEGLLHELNCDGFDGKIASGGGRMQITMDRYEANWSMVKRGWDTHVLGLGEQFTSATEAVTSLREKTGAIDQDLPAFVIAENGEPVGMIEDHDSVVLFNFRGDRAIEISRAFDEPDFDKFDRIRYPEVIFAGMLQYDGDLLIPKNFLVAPPHIENTLTETLVANHVKEYAVSETQKFGHVTYFWNGNRSGKVSEELETYEEVLSDTIPFEQRPWMKAAEITDKIIEAIESDEYGFIRANFPNGDMVGHTGSFQAAKIGVEAVDLCLGRIKKAVDKAGYVLVITADHGNADEMYEKKKGDGEPKAKTAHTLNPVPFIIYDPNDTHQIREGDFGLSNVAATVVTLMGIEKPAEWNDSILLK